VIPEISFLFTVDKSEGFIFDVPIIFILGVYIAERSIKELTYTDSLAAKLTAKNVNGLST